MKEMRERIKEMKRRKEERERDKRKGGGGNVKRSNLIL